MGVDVYVAKRRAQKYRVLGSSEKVAIHPLHWANRLRDQDDPDRYLLASHRGSAMGWKDQLARGEAPLVTVAEPSDGWKWEPEEGQPVYRFAGKQSGIIPEKVYRKEWWNRGEVKPAAGYGVPCFWHDCDPIGELVGHLVRHANGEWMVVMVPTVEEEVAKVWSEVNPPEVSVSREAMERMTDAVLRAWGNAPASTIDGLREVINFLGEFGGFYAARTGVTVKVQEEN